MTARTVGFGIGLSDQRVTMFMLAGLQRANFHPAHLRRVRAVGRLNSVSGVGQSVEEFVQQLVEGIFSCPPGRRRSFEIDR